MDPLNLWKPLVWKFTYQFSQSKLIKKLSELETKIISPSSLEVGNSFSTVNVSQEYRPHFWEELEDFNYFLKSKIAFLWEEYEFKMKNTSHIQESWFNVHKNTGTTLEHYHNGINLVVTSYIKLPKNSGYIEFRDPLEYQWSNTPIIPEEKLWTEVECKTNDVLIFPGWLRHRVQENKTNEERIVLTYNIV